MNHLHHHRMRRGLLAGTVVLGLGGLIGANAASAVIPVIQCVVSVGVSQSDTTVTGTGGNDIIDCSAASPGKTI
ncbi:MAG TPA: hypothetical protein VGR08_12630, partial [Thermomicrobiales bacterium]|nr:hypothetical protein [Thermomicrobiales bacterium]